ncbi:MAG: hypothetical protein QNJ53_25560 [Pleurocapsa sp. MO_192.B19]|nr:hypothetical protein [Pleurocapsa sp. MO_192.B19]
MEPHPLVGIKGVKAIFELLESAKEHFPRLAPPCPRPTFGASGGGLGCLNLIGKRSPVFCWD